MARKKRTTGGRDSKKKRPKRTLGELPDRRVMEAVFQQLAAGLRGQEPEDTPLGKAQAMIYRTMDEPNERRRIQLARDALAICPDCADAYVLLAEHAPSRKEALRLYEQGVAAGERALEPETFERDAGDFWGILETRPYMRARLGLAHVLWTMGRREEAVQHLQDMLRLNPNDNQGLRYTLAGFLLFLDRDDDLAQLLEQYPEEGSAAWAYTRALLAFRRQGDTPEARQLLKQAKKANKHVPAYLLDEKFPPAEQPAYYSFGDESEAIEYIQGFLAAWKSTPGAIAWLREQTHARKRKTKRSPQGPLGLIKKWLIKHLPQESTVWQADFRPLPNWINVSGQPVRPWIILVIDRTNGLVLAHKLLEETPSPALLWDALVQAMRHPAEGNAHRPTELQIRADEHWEALPPHLDEIGVELTAADQLDEMDVILRQMGEQICGEPEPALLDVPGVTPAQVAGFYEAAAFFFQQSPWKKVGYESAIRVECDKFQSGPWYAVLMGQSGMTMGLALYEDLETLRRMWSGDGNDEENARQTVATTVTFGEEWTIPPADMDAAKHHGWPVARPDAYPQIFHKDRGLATRPPLAWELELMEACLRAIPGFVERRQQDDPTREEIAVPVASGSVKLVLAWVEEVR